MKPEQFIARVAAGLRNTVPPPGDFRFPLRVVLRRSPANILGKFEPFVRLQLINGMFDFRETHRRKTYELRLNKQGESESPESKTFTEYRNSGLMKLVKANDEIENQLSTLTLS